MKQLLSLYSKRLLYEILERSYVIKSYDDNLESVKEYLQTLRFDKNENEYYVLSDIEIRKPIKDNEKIYPSQALKGNYNVSIYGTITFKNKKNEVIKKEELAKLCEYPLMIGSKFAFSYTEDEKKEILDKTGREVPNIPDGYFILEKKTYEICNWELVRKNIPLIYNTPKGPVVDLISENDNYISGKCGVKYDNTLMYMLIHMGRKTSYGDKEPSYVNFLAFLIFFLFIKKAYIYNKIKGLPTSLNTFTEIANIIDVVKIENNDDYNLLFDIKFTEQTLYKQIIDKFLIYVNYFDKDNIYLSTKEAMYHCSNNPIDEKIKDSKPLLNEGFDNIFNIIITILGMSDPVIKKKYGDNMTFIDKLMYYNEFLDNYFLPHLKDSVINKLFFLSEMIYKITANKLDESFVDNRDDSSVKEYDTAGYALKMLFIKGVKKVLKDETKKKTFTMSFNSIKEILNSSYVICHNAIVTGRWGTTNKIGKNHKIRTSMTQGIDFLDRKGILFLTRISISSKDEGQTSMTGRQIEPSYIPYFCSSDTTEGKNCGYVKNTSLHTSITDYVNPIHELNLITSMNLFSLNYTIGINDAAGIKETIVLINEDIIGFTSNPIEFRNKLVGYRRKGIINMYTSISFMYSKVDSNKILKLVIRTNEGRLTAPFFVVKDGRVPAKEYILEEYKKGKKVTFTDLVNNGYIEYIDSMEKNVIGNIEEHPDNIVNKNSQYAMIHPSYYLSRTLSYAVFIDMTAVQRNTFFANLAKAISNYVATGKEYELRGDIPFSYPTQRPIIGTELSDQMQNVGYNLMIAIIPDEANIEDAIIWNRDSATMLGVHTIQYTHHDVSVGVSIGLGKDVKQRVNRELAEVYGFRDGIISVGSIVKKNTLLGYKVSMGDTTNAYGLEAIIYSGNREGIVDEIINVGQINGEYNEYVVRVRHTVFLGVGDKFTSRMGQKGVVSQLKNKEDMPYDDRGRVPDVQINPHSIPGRLTASQLAEMLIGMGFVGGMTRTIQEMSLLYNDYPDDYDFYIPVVYLDKFYGMVKTDNIKTLSDLTADGKTMYEIINNDDKKKIYDSYYVEKVSDEFKPYLGYVKTDESEKMKTKYHQILSTQEFITLLPNIDINSLKTYNKYGVKYNILPIELKEKINDMDIRSDIEIKVSIFKIDKSKVVMKKYMEMNKEAPYIKWSDLSERYKKILSSSDAYKKQLISDAFIVSPVEPESMSKIELKSFEKNDYLVRAQEKLKAIGLRESKTTFFNPITGMKMASSTFVGIIHMYKLKQVSESKMYGTSDKKFNKEGSLVKGKAEEGGMKFGRLEEGALVVHNVPSVYKNIVVTSGNFIDAPICSKCGSFGAVIDKKFKCYDCLNEVDFKTMKIPYIAYFMANIFRVMGIKMSFTISEAKEKSE